MSKKLQWVPVPRKYRAEIGRDSGFSKTISHPLQGLPDTELRVSPKPESPVVSLPPIDIQEEEELDDPLFDDPLNPRPKGGFRRTAFNTHATLNKTETVKLKRKVEDLLDWELLRKETLATYTTQKNIPVVSRIVDDLEKEPEVITLTERARRRLEGLDEEDDDSKGTKKIMTQKELVVHLESLADDLEDAWGKGEKVKSLRIVIQSCKLLVSCPVPQVYPSLFILVAKVLDTFGRLVFDRIKRRAQFDERTGRPIQTLPDDFRSSDIPDEAKEMCKNWFFKVAAIRELIPRVYIEVCLWECNRFLVDNHNHYSEMMGRFVAQMRGMGDPLVANYARVYLLHKAADIFRNEIPLSHRAQCFEDWNITRRQWQGLHFQNYLQASGQSMDEYIHLYSPSVQWELAWLAVGADDARFEAALAVFDQCRLAMVLLHIISTFSPQLISRHVAQLLNRIQGASSGVISRHACYTALGVKLTKEPPPEKLRLKVLNDVWTDMAEVNNPAVYMAVAQAWLEFVVKHMSHREMAILMGDVQQHVGQDAFAAGLEGHVQSILCILLENTTDFSVLLSLDPLLPLIDMLQHDSKVDLCKTFLTNFTQTNSVVSDPVLINSLLDICRTLHDSLTEFSIEDDRRQFAQLICCVLNKVSYGKDLDGELNFYVECRRSFSKLDAVIESCVMGVIRLVNRALKLTTIRQHSRKAAAFVKACLAYCHITLPSLADIFKKLRLLLLAAMVALCAGFAEQADTLMGTLFQLLEEVPAFTLSGTNIIQGTEAQMGDFLLQLLAALIVVPGPPNQTPLHWFSKALAVIQEYQWDAVSPVKGQIKVAALRALSALGQEELPYHFASGDTTSNDELYAGSKDYRTQVETACTSLLEDILTDIATLAEGDRVAATRGAELACELLAATVGCAEPLDKVRNLAVKLWAVAAKQLQNDRLMLAVRSMIKASPTWASVADRLT